MQRTKHRILFSVSHAGMIAARKIKSFQEPGHGPRASRLQTVLETIMDLESKSLLQYRPLVSVLPWPPSSGSLVPGAVLLPLAAAPSPRITDNTVDMGFAIYMKYETIES